MNILLVEDNALVAKLAATMLERAGHRVEVAASTIEALTIERNGEPIDLLVTDVVLEGGQNGYALIEQITERRIGLRIVVVSGYAAIETLPPIHDARSVVFLQKPYTEKELLAAVDSAA